jgi:hypothetical protein
MKWFLAGEDITLEAEVVAGGIPAQPDAGTASGTVRDPAGTILPGLDHVPLDVPGTTISLVVPAAQNLLASGADSEARYVTFIYRVNGQSHQQTLAYALYPFLPLETNEDAVRAVMGLSVDELPDDDIEIIPAWFNLRDEYGTDFTNAFTMTGPRRTAANRVLAARAALNTLPSLQLRLVQSRQVENAQFSRWDWIDFDRLKSDLVGVLSSNLQLLSTSLALTLATQQTFFTVSHPVDPLTNA